jgi:hypothetical protein
MLKSISKHNPSLFLLDVNVSFKSIENGIVNLYAPVFSGVKYHMAKNISDYVDLFNKRLAEHKHVTAAFSCNCILNFLYGGLEDKKLEASDRSESLSVLDGPITFGEIAYQLVNQTLVYVEVI